MLPIKLLIVDDLEENLFTLEAVLRANDLELHRAKSGTEALELLLKHEFALAIVDVHMPDMTGFELAEVMRGAEKTRRIPIIFLTAGTPDDSRFYRAYESGAVDFIHKPFNSNILATKVNVFIELERKRQETVLQRDAISQNETRLRVAFASAELVLWDWDIIDDKMTWSNGATTLAQPSESSITKTRQQFLESIHDEDRDQVRRELDKCTFHQDQFRCKYRTYGKDGIQWKLGNGNILRSRCGHAERMIGVERDITSECQALSQLESAKLAAERANAAKDSFLAVLSHELRNPLAPIKMLTTLWELENKLPAEYHEGLGMIQRNIDLECRLIDDMLDISRIAKGKLELRFEKIDVRDLIRNVQDIVHVDCVQKNITLQIEDKAKNTLVKIDAARIQQVLWNLLNNAVKFTPPGGSIVIFIDNVNDRLRIHIKDSGIGIASDKLDRIFDAFEQGDQAITREFGGLGLGLSISKAIMNLHSGTLQAYSEGKGKGAEFTLELSTLSEAATATDMGGLATVDIPHVAGGVTLHVLLVEDQQPLALLTERLLNKLGHTTQIANSIRDAAIIWQEAKFDLVISDFGLPDGDGSTLLEHLDAKGKIPAIALTGYGMDRDVKRALELGFQCHLTKPVGLRALLNAIEQATASIPKATRMDVSF